CISHTSYYTIFFLCGQVLILTSLIVTMSFICVIKSGDWNIVDLSPIAVICTSAFVALSTASLFYYRKAQAENVIKISKQIQEENIEVQNLDIANQIMNSDFNS
ncbi:MAG: hypothetical protein NC253_08470, partial [Ruminococcus sp.]|nr:hypothetical protein [Ruminococcus sp.]